MMGLAAALSLLTRIPLPVTLEASDLRHAANHFALVGLLLGLPSWALARATPQLGPAITATLVLLWLALISGALHLDGVGDVADGMGGGQGDRARTLAIMRDSRVGAHGVVGICLLLICKFAALQRCLELELAHALWLAPLCGRAFAVPLLCLPNGRTGGLADHVRPGQPGLALGLNGLVLLTAMGFAPHLWPALLACAGVVTWLGRWALRRLGGITGDVLGAAIESSEVAFLVATVAACNGR